MSQYQVIKLMCLSSKVLLLLFELRCPGSIKLTQDTWGKYKGDFGQWSKGTLSGEWYMCTSMVHLQLWGSRRSQKVLYSKVRVGVRLKPGHTREFFCQLRYRWACADRHSRTEFFVFYLYVFEITVGHSSTSLRRVDTVQACWKCSYLFSYRVCIYLGGRVVYCND